MEMDTSNKVGSDANDRDDVGAILGEEDDGLRSCEKEGDRRRQGSELLERGGRKAAMVCGTSITTVLHHHGHRYGQHSTLCCFCILQ